MSKKTVEKRIVINTVKNVTRFKWRRRFGVERDRITKACFRLGSNFGPIC